jgi:hypothetical protein
MRVTFLVLVLANLLFFGWANWVDRPVARVRTAAPVPALQLAPASAGRADAAAAAPLCRSLGPYADETAAAAAATVLGRRGIVARARHVETAVVDGYWVYIVAAGPGRQQQVMQQLARAGVRDAAVVAGEAGGLVSAGIFTEQQGAEARAAAVRSAGLEPVLEARQKTTSAWWLDLTLADADAAPRVDDAELRAGGAELQLIDCP